MTTDDQITVGVAADISDFTAGMAAAGVVADQTFGRIRASSAQAADGMDASFAAGADQLTKQQQKLAASWLAMFRPINAAFDSSITGMILGTTTWQKAVARVFAQIEIDTAVAAAGAMAATAAIPVVGPALAPEVAAATYAETLGWAAGMGGGIASAAGGLWDVPGTMLSLLHPEESVIPASVANPMRAFFAGGATANGAGGDIHIHGPLVSAIDTQSGAQFLKNNMRAIAKGLATELRNFNASLTPALNG